MCLSWMYIFTRWIFVMPDYLTYYRDGWLSSLATSRHLVQIHPLVIWHGKSEPISVQIPFCSIIKHSSGFRFLYKYWGEPLIFALNDCVDLRNWLKSYLSHPSSFFSLGLSTFKVFSSASYNFTHWSAMPWTCSQLSFNLSACCLLR